MTPWNGTDRTGDVGRLGGHSSAPVLTAVSSPMISRTANGFFAVPIAMSELAAGRAVLLAGSDGRHGDLVAAADQMTPELMAFIVRHSSGFVCVALDETRADELVLPAQAVRNQNRRGTARGTAFGVTVDAATGIGTGISATDRCRTVRLLAAGDTVAEDFTRPGHIVTLRARAEGVLRRQGHAEAAVDLMRLAGVAPVAVLADLVLDELPPHDELGEFLGGHDLQRVSVAEVYEYRRENERLVERAAAARVPTAAGEFTAVGYRSTRDQLEHVAFVYGDVAGPQGPVSVYVHRESLIADVFGGPAPTPTLDSMLRQVADDGCGVLIYLRSADATATGLVASLQRMYATEKGAKALPMESSAADTAQLARQILDDLDVRDVNLLSAAHTFARGRSTKGC